MNSVCVCGAGTMGSGIAQLAAGAGFKTILFDISTDMIATAETKLTSDLQKLVSKQKISEDQREKILNNIDFTSDLNKCRADLIIEAVVEKSDVKVGLFQSLASINEPSVIFASNTSSLSITKLAEQIPSPQRFAGMHFFNPAPVMKLVEVVKGDKTSDEIIGQIVGVAKAMGKTPVVCKDAPGFIVNRVARPFYIESLRLAEEGVADFETIDLLLQSAGFKMGPFKLMDLIGNDVNYSVSCSVYDQLNRPERLRPSNVQQEKVEKGELGKKTGSGYYHY